MNATPTHGRIVALNARVLQSFHADALGSAVLHLEQLAGSLRAVDGAPDAAKLLPLREGVALILELAADVLAHSSDPQTGADPFALARGGEYARAALAPILEELARPSRWRLPEVSDPRRDIERAEASSDPAPADLDAYTFEPDAFGGATLTRTADRESVYFQPGDDRTEAESMLLEPHGALIAQACGSYFADLSAPGAGWTIIDEETAEGGGPPRIGHPLQVVQRFATEADATAWLDAPERDRAKVERGGYGLDGPADDDG